MKRVMQQHALTVASRVVEALLDLFELNEVCLNLLGFFQVGDFLTHLVQFLLIGNSRNLHLVVVMQ